MCERAITYLVFIQLVKCLGFDFFDGVVLAGGNVFCLVNFGVLLSRTE